MSDNPFQSPLSPSEPPPGGGGDVVSTLIPYKNSASLVAYYSGVFSIMACLPLLGVFGVVLAVVAIVYGVKGLRFAKEHPEARGKVHCWIGILGGVLCLLPGLAIQGIFIIAIIGELVK